MGIGSFIKKIIHNRNDEKKLEALRELVNAIEEGKPLSKEQLKLGKTCTNINSVYWSINQQLGEKATDYEAAKTTAINDIKKKQEEIIERCPAMKALDAEIKTLEAKMSVWKEMVENFTSTVENTSEKIFGAQEDIQNQAKAEATIGQAKEDIKSAYQTAMKHCQRKFKEIFKKDKEEVRKFREALGDVNKAKDFVSQGFCKSTEDLEAKKNERANVMKDAKKTGKLPEAKQQEQQI